MVLGPEWFERRAQSERFHIDWRTADYDGPVSITPPGRPPEAEHTGGHQPWKETKVGERKGEREE